VNTEQLQRDLSTILQKQNKTLQHTIDMALLHVSIKQLREYFNTNLQNITLLYHPMMHNCMGRMTIYLLENGSTSFSC
jgi:hypothetical protein